MPQNGMHSLLEKNYQEILKDYLIPLFIYSLNRDVHAVTPLLGRPLNLYFSCWYLTLCLFFYNHYKGNDFILLTLKTSLGEGGEGGLEVRET